MLRKPKHSTTEVVAPKEEEEEEEDEDDHKCLYGFEMWCWRRMEKISWTDYVRNVEVYVQPRRWGISYIQ
jgi:hypothetical protein